MRHSRRVAAKDATALSGRHLRGVREIRTGNHMNWNVLRLLYVHEMKMLVRGRRTVVMALVLPAVIMPLMLYAQKYSVNRRERLLAGTTYRYAVTGPQADRLRILIHQTQQNLDGIPDAEVEKLRQFKLVEVRVPNPTE